MDESEYMMPGEEVQEELDHMAFRLRKKLKTDYTELCKTKGMTRSRRLRQFMIYELKKDAAAKAEAAKAEAAKAEEKKRLEEAEARAKVDAETQNDDSTYIDPFQDQGALS